VTESILTIWTVYRSPSDHPGKWVLRGHDVTAAGSVPRPDCIVADTLDLIRDHLPPGLCRLPRDAADDPVIYESWV
jgi:hypothetical protein